MPDNYQQVVKEAVSDMDRFLEVTFRNAERAPGDDWVRITIRPVAIKGERFLQFIRFDGRQESATNLSYREASQAVEDLLNKPLKSIHSRTTRESIRVQFSKKGRPIVHRQSSTQQASIPLDLAHDRRKPYLLPDNEPIPFLQAIGVMTADGRVRADQQRKFRQINEFLRIIDESGEITPPAGQPLRVADLGCGSAALTFATYYYLNHLKNIPTTMVGVDTKDHLMARLSQSANDLNWPGLAFETARIGEYHPTFGPPEIVLALHACDTATDEALARAILWGSRYIFCAPCCHHHLQAQLANKPMPVLFEPVLRHGILRERFGDILTDAFRALILRLMGYRTDVLEFIPIEHTPKNLMIRAVFTHSTPSAAIIREYRELKAFWGVTPYLETLLQERFDSILTP